MYSAKHLKKGVSLFTDLFQNTNWCSVDYDELCLVNIMHACMLSFFSHAQLFETLLTVACQAPLLMGFSRQEHWSGLLCPPPGDFVELGIELVSPDSPGLQADSLPTEPPGNSQ